MLLLRKWNGNQTEKATTELEENFCQLYIWQEINNQNLMDAQKTKRLINQ
jgi:hypothetical protein